MKRLFATITVKIAPLIKEKPGLVMACAICLLMVIGCWGFLSSRLDQSGDLVYHLAAEGQVAQAIREGQSPFGPLALNFGTPVLRFYQPLLYLVVAPIQVILGINILWIHNLVLLIFFLVTPFALYYGYRSLGFSEVTTGLCVMITTLSVAGFGNSFEAYFTVGVVNQLMGAVFFPLFLGTFNLLLQGKRGPIPAAVFLALTFVSHVMMAVYAAFAGALLLLTEYRRVRPLLKPLLIFSILSLLLVTFWFVPFLNHWESHRPVPDSVALPGDAFLSTSVTSSQAAKLLLTGRLLDDSKAMSGGGQDEYDKLLDRMTMCPTLVTRPPVLTVLVLLGLALCLFRLKSAKERFLVAGFLFSFLLLMGPDDVPWLSYLPFTKRMQYFRCTYLFEFFAFGLAGNGLWIIGGFIVTGIRRLQGVSRTAITIGALVMMIAGLFFFLKFFFELAETHVNPGSRAFFDRALKVANRTRDDFPLRMTLSYGNYRTEKRLLSYLGAYGLHAVCGHWRIVGPLVAQDLCIPLRKPGANLSIARKAGVGFYLVNRERAVALNKIKTKNDEPVMRQEARGNGNYLYRDTDASFLWAANRPVLTIATSTQWFYLTRAWTKRMYPSSSAEPPTPVRLPPGERLEKSMLQAFDAVWLLSPETLEQSDLEILSEYAASDGTVLSVQKLSGLKATILKPDGKSLLDTIKTGTPLPEVAIRPITVRRGRPFEYKVSSSRPAVVVLPEFAVDGWRAEVDGQRKGVFSAGPNMVASIIPQGHHQIRLWWQTTRLDWICFSASGLTLLGLIGFGIFSAARKRT